MSNTIGKARSWSQLLRRLAEGHRLIRYDGRGNGLSDRDIGDISFDVFVRDLTSVVEAAGLKRAAFLGISQGAAVAIAYAVQHPERVSKLVLHGAYAQGRNKRASPVDAEMARAFITIMRQGWGDEHSAFMKAFSSVYLPTGSPEQIKWATCSGLRPPPRTPSEFAPPAMISTLLTCCLALKFPHWCFTPATIALFLSSKDVSLPPPSQRRDL